MVKARAWLVAGVLLLLPAVSVAQTKPTAEERSRKGWYKVVGGTLSASIGLGLVAAGNHKDPFTGDKSTGLTALGLAMSGGGAFLIWNGYKDIQSARSPSLAIAVTRNVAAVVYRRSW